MVFERTITITALLILGLAALILAPTFKQIFQTRNNQDQSAQYQEQQSNDAPHIDLKSQLETLQSLGIELKPGFSEKNISEVWTPENFESSPYSFLLFVMGTEIQKDGSWTYMSDAAWDFDTEYITGSGSYAEILENLSRLTGGDPIAIGISDTFDFSKQIATVKYQINDERKSINVKVDSDWVDPKFVSTVLKEISIAANDGRRFYGIDNGQAITLLFIDRKTMLSINKLAPNTLIPY